MLQKGMKSNPKQTSCKNSMHAAPVVKKDVKKDVKSK